MSDQAEPVCAVVVTHNRKALLMECIDALLHQTKRVDQILIVDNASTDGTRELLHERRHMAAPQIKHIALPENVGGAGGFHEGVKRAIEHDCTWLWLLDDDTIAHPTALEELFSARGRFAAGIQPDLLASKVEWTDGSMHPMNVPRLKRSDRLESAVRAAEQGTISIRASSFVSLVIHRRFVEQHGFPIADYFIWNDDVEYTARILRDSFGVMVPASVVVHKTAEKRTPAGPRFYYSVRNTFWMAMKSPAWTTEERCKLIGALIVSALRYVANAPARWAALRVVAKGVWDGLVDSPTGARS